MFWVILNRGSFLYVQVSIWPEVRSFYSFSQEENKRLEEERRTKEREVCRALSSILSHHFLVLREYYYNSQGKFYTF